MFRRHFRIRKIGKVEHLHQLKIQADDTNNVQNKYVHDPEAIEREIEEKDAELLRIKSFFPIDIFPNELVIRRKTVTLIKRNFLTSNTETFLVKDIGLVQINSAVFFSQIRVSYKAPYEDMVISNIVREQAKQAKSLLDKLMLVKNEYSRDESVMYDPFPSMYYRTAS